MYMWMLFLWMMILGFGDGVRGVLPEDTSTITDTYDVPTRPNDKFSTSDYPYVRGGPDRNALPDEEGPQVRRCSRRLEDALDQLRRRQIAKQKTHLRLDGYALHQQLRSAPMEVLVSDMRVRLPPASGWVRVDRCRFDPLNASLETRLLFNDLTISGKVNLLEGGGDLRRAEPRGENGCNMVLRLRKAGIGFHTEPIRRERGHFNVKTDSHFLEPGFISVYAYGCEPRLREHRRDFRDEEDGDAMSKEMEDIFLKGIRSLLTSYMQKELQPAIKETLMRNMGYTISYG